MSIESSKRSSLIDVTHAQLHSILLNRFEGTTPAQLREYLEPRKQQLCNLKEPFGKPNSASRKSIESGLVTLADGVSVRVEAADRDYVLAISDKFQIDEVQALICLRSFLYNEGLPATQDSASLIRELVEAITPFYQSERLAILRVFLPLIRIQDEPSHPYHTVVLDFLPRLLPDGRAFANSVIEEYIRKTNEKVPMTVFADPNATSRWAKQNYKEQLILLEVLFWLMWGYVPCDGSLVEKILCTAYGTNLGSTQANGTVLLDDESIQLQQDSAALWILISVEILELESVGGEPILFSDNPTRNDFYVESPQHLKNIHEMITSHTSSQYACIYLAWSYVLSRISIALKDIKEIPSSYRPFFDALNAQATRSSYAKETELLHTTMCRASLGPDVGLFNFLQNLLLRSPLFVTTLAYKTASTLTDPNAVAFRSVLKGLIMALVELVPVELVPDFEGFVEVWIALFGRSEPAAVGGICRQYWEYDFKHGIARRAIFDVARSRFPIQVRPLIRLLRAMTGAGFLDTDPLYSSTARPDDPTLFGDRDTCDTHVFFFMEQMPTFSQVIPLSACTGVHSLYEKQPERYGSSGNSGLIYVNNRPIKLPGGSTLPARSQGRLLSGDGGDLMVVCWKHQHSGWKLLLEFLTEYVNRRRLSGSMTPFHDVSFERKSSDTAKELHLEDIGVEIHPSQEDAVATDILDLVRSLIQDNPDQAQQLMDSLEQRSQTPADAQATSLIQLTSMILEEALSRSNAQPGFHQKASLVTSAMSVLSALLSLPGHAAGVWVFLRSTPSLFASERGTGFASIALAAERATGQYTMTLALLHLVQKLFQEASSNVLSDTPRLRQVKDEVLLRARQFIHAEIWVEHLGWKYTNLGDRFEIGRRIAALYTDVLENSSPLISNRPFVQLSQGVADAFIFRPAISSITPLVSSINTGSYLLRSLFASRRNGDAGKLIYLLGAYLKILRVLLSIKLNSGSTSKSSLLEQSLCSRVAVAGGVTPQDAFRSKMDVIDILALYTKERDLGSVIPLEAMRVLYLLCSTFSVVQPPSATIIGHLSNPESTVTSLVRIVQHPYDDLQLRLGVWRFISLAVDREPALATLFVTGQFRTPIELTPWEESKGKESSSKELTLKPKNNSAVDVAREMLAGWRALWDATPELLAGVLQFLNAVWQHGLEHLTVLSQIAKDGEFWNQIVGIITEELPPAPDYEADDLVEIDGVPHLATHEAISMHCNRIVAKSHAIQIIALDIGLQRQHQNQGVIKGEARPLSFAKIEPQLTSSEDFSELLSEATPSSYAPSLHDDLVAQLDNLVKDLKVEQLQPLIPVTEREFGDDFSFSAALLRRRLKSIQQADPTEIRIQTVEKLLLMVNLNLSLTTVQKTLAESWTTFIRHLSPFLRGNDTVRRNVLTITGSISYDIANERRSGDVMATIHGTRLALLLALLELAWWSNSDKPEDVKPFIEVTKNVHNILLNESQPLSSSFLGTLSVPFHRIVLQVVYFLVRQARILSHRPKMLNAEQRSEITAMVNPAVSLVIDALRVVFLSARSRIDVELDKDMELLVATFEQCIHREIGSSASLWLVRCQETDVLKASLDLFSHTDLVGLTDLSLLFSRKQPLYAPHILQFHMALVNNPASAERLASEGILAAYANNFISGAASVGMIDVALPELPGERSPAHRAYTSMMSVVAGVISALGRNMHYFEAEASGFVQLYGDQISRPLSWNSNEPITFPLLEELEQVVNLFFAIAESSPATPKPKPAVEKVLRVFTTHALMLLQQITYAVTHPNHLATLLEPVTTEERISLEREAPIRDPLKRPMIAHLVHRLFRLSSNILATLVIISQAGKVLTLPQEDWPMQEALLLPHSKVVSTEPASIGTLLDLGNATLDVLRELSSRPANQSLILVTGAPVASSATSDVTLDVRQGILTARRNLESIMLYAVTQLAMWLLKPEFEVTDVEMEDGPGHGTNMELMLSVSKEGGKERDRRVSRATTNLADRLRRGMTGEMASDLQMLLNKAKAALPLTEAAVGKNCVDITPILLSFLQERIITS